MTNIQRVTILALVFSTTLFTSCVGKKRYLAALNSISDLQNSHKMEVNQWKDLLTREKNSNQTLTLQLAEKKGESAALTNMQDKLQSRIDDLELQLENVNSQSMSSNELLNSTISSKDNQIQALTAKINSIRILLDQYNASSDQLAGDLSLVMQSFASNEYAIETTNEGVKVILFEKLIFVKGSSSRITKSGQNALELISSIIQRYPDKSVVVAGHTDNDPPSNNSYRNNWIFSSLRAAYVVNSLVNDYDVSASQLTATGKGEFTPRVSNDSPSGKEMNRRIELLFQPNEQGLDRAIRKKI